MRMCNAESQKMTSKKIPMLKKTTVLYPSKGVITLWPHKSPAVLLCVQSSSIYYLVTTKWGLHNC